MLPSNAFIVNEAHWITLDRRYLLVVEGSEIAGMCVGGQLLATLRSDYPTDPMAYADEQAVKRYLAMDVRSREFLAVDRRNFVCSAPEVRGFTISRRRALWTGGVPNSGAVTLDPRNGRKRRMILLGQQDLDALASLLMATGAPKLAG